MKIIEVINKTKKKNSIIIKNIKKLFDNIKIIKPKKWGIPVVTKLYFLKFSNTFKSLTLFSNNKARDILFSGLKEIHNTNKHTKYKGIIDSK